MDIRKIKKLIELIEDSDVAEIEMAGFLGHAGMENDLEQQITQFVRILNRFPVKTDREPSLTGVVVDDIDHDKQGMIVALVAQPPQRVTDSGAFMKLDVSLLLVLQGLKKR